MIKSVKSRIVAVISILLIAGYQLWPTQKQVDPEHSNSFTEPVILSIKEAPMKKQEVKKKAVIVSLLSSSKSAFLISKVYAEELVFPSYSQPLTNQAFDRLNPNHFNPQSMPIDDEGRAIIASLSKYRYSYPEPIVVMVEGEGVESASLVLSDTNTKKILLTETFQLQENTWQASLAGKKDFPDTLQAKVIANVGGKSIPIVLALKYVNPVAIIEAFEPAKAEGADMVINAKVVTKKSGLYRIRANLFDVEHQPIAHLVSKKKLQVGDQQIALKAHQSVLQGRKSPFYLSTFMVELMSPSPGVRKQFGESAITKFEIKDFALSSLDSSPYQASAQEKQRLELLQAMANKGE